MQKFNFIGKLSERVSKRMNKPVTKEQILSVLVNVLVFTFLALSALLYVACFIFVCITE